MADNGFIDKIKTQVSSVAGFVKENETVKKLSAQVGVEPVALAGGVSLFVVVFTYFIFGAGLLQLNRLLYPVYASLKAIELRRKRTTLDGYYIGSLRYVYYPETSQMCCYWIPFYFAFKLGFLVWLMLPGHNGAELIYKKVLKPFITKSAAFATQSSPESVGKMD